MHSQAEPGNEVETTGRVFRPKPTVSSVSHGRPGGRGDMRNFIYYLFESESVSFGIESV